MTIFILFFTAGCGALWLQCHCKIAYSAGSGLAIVYAKLERGRFTCCVNVHLSERPLAPGNADGPQGVAGCRRGWHCGRGTRPTLCAGAAVEAQVPFPGSGELHCSGSAVPFFLPRDYLRGLGGPKLPITHAGSRRRSFTSN